MDRLTIAGLRDGPDPEPWAAGLRGLYPAAEDIDTDLLMQRHARTIRAAGGRSAQAVRLPRWIGRRLDGVRLGTETLDARIIVNAAGAWVDGVARLAGIAPLGFRPLRRSMAQIPPPGGHDVAAWPMLISAGETWYAKPQAGKLLVSPADTDPVEPHDAWADDMVPGRGLARYEDGHRARDPG
ncbi:MAG: FAD-dependent oxidoreductase [Paracoccaceae bacterium]